VAGRLDGLVFDNRFTRELPADPETAVFPRQVTGACYSRVKPAGASRPRLIAHAEEVSELLDLSLDPTDAGEFARVFSGTRILEGMDPVATCYGGHQFGVWAGQLGDGRAINLGEVVNGRGERWVLQLKGAGPTPYARKGDGFAVLRSSVREFLCSEAMHHLGVPSTRALSLVSTGDSVMRDMLYDGNLKMEPGAVVCRVAPSFTRFGHFEIFASRRDFDTLRHLADHTIRTDFPHLGEPSPEVYAEWFAEVCRTTAEMVVHWMRVGFVHGVMNTDNMSILGLTIDYGPYGWLEGFDPDWTPNTTDAAGRRYRFGNQPHVAHWNLGQLGNALLPLVGEAGPLEEGLATYARTFDAEWGEMMLRKLGLDTFRKGEDESLFTELHAVLQAVETDMTIFFRRLADVGTQEAAAGGEPDGELPAPLRDAYYDPEVVSGRFRADILAWLGRYRARVRQEGTPDPVRRTRMNQVNPKYVLRNYLAQMAIDRAEQDDFTLVSELLDLLRAPYDEQPEREEYAAKRPEWARHRVGCSMLSCSS